MRGTQSQLQNRHLPGHTLAMSHQPPVPAKGPSSLMQATVVRTADALARKHPEAAIDLLAEMMLVADKDADKIKAATELLDRGHGKPLAATIQLPVTRRLAQQLEALSEAELISLATKSPTSIELAEREAQDAEFTEVPLPRPSKGEEPAAAPADFDFE